MFEFIFVIQIKLMIDKHNILFKNYIKKRRKIKIEKILNTLINKIHVNKIKKLIIIVSFFDVFEIYDNVFY